MIVKYSSNNSGGDFWLSRKNWEDMESNGWELDGESKIFGVYTSASKDFDSLKEAIREFEKITGQTASDEGCNCCGPPHAFKVDETSGYYKYVSGKDIIDVLEINDKDNIIMRLKR